MRVLVVYCHPVETSFCAAIHARVRDALITAGHEIRDLDLYAEGFDPVLSRQERLDYHDTAVNMQPVAAQIEHLRWAEALVLVFPTWWYGMPAMLKGWFDRVWVPGFCFQMPEGNMPIRPNMLHIRKLAVATTYGSPWWWIQLLRDPNRRVLLRGLRALCHPRCQTLWLAHYKMDSSTAQERRAFLDKVGLAFSRF